MKATELDDPAREDVQVVPPTDRAEVAEDERTVDPSYVAAIQRDYGQYRARMALQVHGVVAFHPGDAVPASHPWRESWQVQGLLDEIG